MAAIATALLGGLPELITGLIRTHKLDQWAKLCFEMMFSFWVSFSFTAGTLLTAGAGAAAAGVNHAAIFTVLGAIGGGMISGAVRATKLWRISPLTKGMQFALPAEEAQKEIELNTQTGSK